MTKLDNLYFSYVHTKNKIVEDILWESDSNWSLYVQDQLENLNFKWSESKTYIFIYIPVIDTGKAYPPAISQFVKNYLGEYIVMKIARNNSYSYLPSLWSKLQDENSLLKFCERTDTYRNKTEFDADIQKILELLNNKDLLKDLQSLKITDLSALKN